MVFGPVSYDFEIDGSASGWHVRRFLLAEALSDVYRCTIDIVHTDVGADVDGLLGSSATVILKRSSGVERRVCGIIHRVQRLGAVRTSLLVRVEVVPALMALKQCTNSRIFQNMPVADILQKVLGDGLQPYNRSIELSLQRSDYVDREYCVQYQENDYDFAQRLMHEEGIYFHFDHSGSEEKMVLVDTNDSLPECDAASGSTIDLIAPGAGAPDKEVVHSLQSAAEMYSTSVTLHEYDWLQPTQPVHQEATGQDSKQRDRLVYDGDPRFVLGASGNDGSARKRLRQEALAVGGATARGEGIVIGFGIGRTFELQGHTLSDLDCKYVITRVSHDGTVPDEWAGGAKGENEYHNRFDCMPADVPFRPSGSVVRPMLPMQTATVVGPSGEEIYTDEHGRIKVQFHWDREGENNEESSCWMRVAQVWAGGGFGMLFVPRIGMEVVVQFVEGDPNRPLVTGCVYNGRNLLPINLPDDKTKSGLVTRSSPDGSTGNELIFEDAADNEEIYLRAQRDWNILVKNDQGETVEGNSTRTVKKDDDNTIEGNHTESITGDDTVSIEGNRSVTVESNYTEDITKDLTTTVSGNASQTVSKNYTLEVTKDVTLTVDGKRTETIKGDSETSITKGLTVTVDKDASVTVKKNATVHSNAEMTLEADKTLTLKCGSASITLKSSGKITIKGSDVEVEGSSGVKLKGSKVGLN